MSLSVTLFGNRTVSERKARVLTVLCLTVGSVVAMAAMVAVPERANAATFEEDFDSGSVTTVSQSLFNVDANPNLIVATDPDCESSPKCVRRPTTGNVYRATAEIGFADQGQFVMFALKEAQINNYIEFQVNASTTGGATIRWEFLGGINIVGNGMSSEGFDFSTTTDEWHGFIIEWRKEEDGDFLEWRGSVTRGVQVNSTAWKSSGVLAGQEMSVTFGLGKNTGTNNSPVVDSATIVTGNAVSGVVGELSSGFNAQTFTRFLDLSFSGTDALIDYYLEEGEIDTTRAETNPTLVRLQYAKQPDVDFSGIGEAINNQIFGSSTATIDLSGLTNGTYDLLIQFANQGTILGGPVPFPDSYIYATVDVSGNTITILGDVEYYDGTAAQDEQSLRACGLTDISGCIINSFVALFIPSTDSLEALADFNDDLSGRFPFAYVYDFQTLVTSLFTDTTQSVPTFEVAFAGGTLTLLSQSQLQAVPYVPFIRTTVGFLLWVTFAFAMYRRTLNIFNPHQTI